jgi:CubicO group peptidase (beta-lactamase class C family)
MGHPIAGGEDAFPAASPESQGLSSESLTQLTDEVRHYLDLGCVIGAELHVIQNRRTVLHEAFGWRDREAEVPMECNSIFNIRSMTKPLTGAALQVLVDQGELELDDPVADYLSAFDNEKSSAITLRQVLTHRGGLPLTALTTDIRQFEDLFSQVTSVGEGGPEFEPASKFWYSDAGTDVVGSVVEEIGGLGLDEFIQEHILDPLEMQNSFYWTDATPHEGDPRPQRIGTLYLATDDSYTKIWSPEAGPLYPFPWGSQTLYSTTADYAKFLAMWMDEGRSGEQQVLSAAAVERSLTPCSVLTTLGTGGEFPDGFPDLQAWYGQMSVLYVNEDKPQTKPQIIGHSGSDGTFAWAWPERDLMVLYFTQSRGGISGLLLERDLHYLLLHPLSESEEAASLERLRPYLGDYRHDGSGTSVSFRAKHGELVVDVPPKLSLPLQEPDDKGFWRCAMAIDLSVAFVHDDSNAVVGMKMGGRKGSKTEFRKVED